MAWRRWAPALACIALASGLSASATASQEESAVLVQVGTYDYLLAPNFAGLIPMDDLLGEGTMGLGTFDNLDGEFVMVGGDAYRVGTDGNPEAFDPEIQTPFAQVTDFRPTASAPIPPGTTCDDMAGHVRQTAGQSDGIVAVRIRGTFSDLVTRSVPEQPIPYPALSEVIAGQTVFHLGQRRAVLVGFWQGPNAAGLGQTGLHLHGVTADRSAGGHVLSCVVGADAQISVQTIQSVRVVTPS